MRRPGFLRLAAVAAGMAAVLAAGFALTGQGAVAQMMGRHHGPGEGRGMGAGMMRHGHDEVTMPGLRGLDASPGESAELATMFRNYTQIERRVEELPDGIRTVTYSADEEVMATLVNHVTGMIGRVQEGRDPQIFIQSPTLDIFFARGDAIDTEIEVTDEGIVVVQTSKDPALVEALHVHAGEVSAMAERGMAAVHEMMMERAAN